MQSTVEDPTLRANGYFKNKASSIFRASHKFFNTRQCHPMPIPHNRFSSEIIPNEVLFRLGWEQITSSDSGDPECDHWLVPKDKLQQLSISLQETISFLTIENGRLREQMLMLKNTAMSRHSTKLPTVILMPPPQEIHEIIEEQEQHQAEHTKVSVYTDL